jgi:phosphoglycerate dehydrogenase-like enzyme
MTILWLVLDEDDITDQQLAETQALLPDWKVIVGRDTGALASDSDKVEIVAGWLKPDDVLHLPNLRWAQHWAAGVDAFTSNPDIAGKDFMLTNGSGVHTIPITEHILAYLLAFARGLHCAVRAQVDHRWGKPDDPCRSDVFELPGKTMVLIGVGAIGERTARMSAALGIRVIGVRRDPTKGAKSVTEMVSPDRLLEVLPRADFVVLTVPLTEATRGMIGDVELRAMKETAIVINIGRGGTIYEEALIRALQEGRIGGAGLDVFENEPLPPDSPLWDMPNVIVTSHYAGHNPHYNDRAMNIFLDNLHHYISGTALHNVVDMEAGY